MLTHIRPLLGRTCVDDEGCSDISGHARISESDERMILHDTFAVHRRCATSD